MEDNSNNNYDRDDDEDTEIRFPVSFSLFKYCVENIALYFIARYNSCTYRENLKKNH